MEVSFAELDADAVATLARVYEDLSLGDFEAARPAAEAHVAGLQLSGFKKNAHRWAGLVWGRQGGRWRILADQGGVLQGGGRRCGGRQPARHPLSTPR